ncbi:MAG: ASKHA domain-containing protein [Pelosinus sp.]|nr:ASKHA domain-containing protein [Pelosinus sp.]
MPMLTNLEIIVDKTKVLDAIQCYKNNPGYEETFVLYDELLPEFMLFVKPAAAYAFIENNAGPAVPEASECSRLVYCVLTLGQEICDKISELFAEGNYVKGSLVNAMCDELLAYYEQEIYRRIKREADLEGCGLTRKLTLDENDFESAYEQAIIEWFIQNSASPERMADNLLLSAKSLVYIYGADSEQLTTEIDHDCSHCDNIGCYMREKADNNGTITLTVIGQDGMPETMEADQVQTILDNLIQGGIYVAAPCNGKGTCGKCKIKIIKGTLRREKANYEKLQPDEINDGVCLACQVYPEEDCTIELLGMQEENFSIATEFRTSPELLLHNGYTVERLILSEADWPSHISLAEYIDLSLNNTYRYSQRALKKVSALTETPADKAISLIINKQTIVDVCSGDAKQILGLAIDIGTTTIVISLVDLRSGTVINSYAGLNSQRQYGADVISRIEHSRSGASKLKECVCQDILAGISALTGDVKARIQHVVIAGNTTMLYLLLGLSAHSLSVYPFRTTTIDFLEFSFGEIFSSNMLDCQVTILPGISAYIGADIVAGLLECGFGSTESTCMLIDIGTNGEMVIGNQRKIMCLAAAAGPAFEGANITSGTGSVKGAISSCTIDKDKLCYQTIQAAPAIGICGSGVIEIAAACLRSNWLAKSGQWNAEKVTEGYLKIAEGVYGDIIFTQQDIRQLQLAKAAIRTGIDILIENYGACYADIDTVYLAGGFGTNIDVESAAAIGLIPRELKYKVKTVGNSALGGAIRYLLNNHKEELNKLKAAAVCLDLAVDDKFNNLFMRNMLF